MQPSDEIDEMETSDVDDNAARQLASAVLQLPGETIAVETSDAEDDAQSQLMVPVTETELEMNSEEKNSGDVDGLCVASGSGGCVNPMDSEVGSGAEADGKSETAGLGGCNRGCGAVSRPNDRQSPFPLFSRSSLLPLSLPHSKGMWSGGLSCWPICKNVSKDRGLRSCSRGRRHLGWS